MGVLLFRMHPHVKFDEILSHSLSQQFTKGYEYCLQQQSADPLPRMSSTLELNTSTQHYRCLAIPKPCLLDQALVSRSISSILQSTPSYP